MFVLTGFVLCLYFWFCDIVSLVGVTQQLNADGQLMRLLFEVMESLCAFVVFFKHQISLVLKKVNTTA